SGIAPDTVNIASTAAGLTTVVFGPANTVVGDHGHLDSIRGEVRIDSINSTRQGQLTVDDSADTAADAVTSSFVNSPQSPIFLANESVIVSGLAPADIRYELDVTDPPTAFDPKVHPGNLSVTLYLGLGSNAFSTFQTNVPLTVVSGGGKVAFTLAAAPASLLAPVAPVDLEGNSGNDTFQILASAASVLLGSGGGNDTFVIGDANNTLDQIQGPILVSAGGGVNSLTINDQGASSGHTYAVTPSTIERTGAATITYDGITSLVINASNGGNILKIGQIGQFPMGLPGD